MTFVLAETLDDVLAAAMPRGVLTGAAAVDDRVECAEPAAMLRAGGGGRVGDRSRGDLHDERRGARRLSPAPVRVALGLAISDRARQAAAGGGLDEARERRGGVHGGARTSTPGATARRRRRCGRRMTTASISPSSEQARRPRAPGATSLNRLVVERVDAETPSRRRSRRGRAGVDRVTAWLGSAASSPRSCWRWPTSRRRVLVGDVLDQRAAERDVDDLDAAADAEDRACRGRSAASNEIELELIALGIDAVGRLGGRRCRRSARIDVGAAAEEEAVDDVERASSTSSTCGGRMTGMPPAALDGVGRRCVESSSGRTCRGRACRSCGDGRDADDRFHA